MVASVRILDFRDEHPGYVGGVNVPKQSVKMGPTKADRKQIRRRVRRRGTITKMEFEALYKPLEEWDIEELARGRPRNRKGDFSGPGPEWMTRQMHDLIMQRFRTVVDMELRDLAGGPALKLIRRIMEDDRVDVKGRPLVSAGDKMRAAIWLLENQVGKPVQRQEVDISVKLQGVLATAMVGPVDQQGRGILASPDSIGFGSMSEFQALAAAGEDRILDAEVISDTEDDDDD